MLLNATILGQPSFCDVHICHHFQPRDDRQSKMTWRWRHFVERAIDAIADLELIFEWLEMNVARAVLDRLVKNEIDKANDRSCVCFGFNCRFAVSLASGRDGRSEERRVGKEGKCA